MNIEDVHKNSKLLIDGIPYNVDEADFMKPGKGSAIYRLKLRNLLNNTTLDRTFKSSDKVDEATISNVQMQYLYAEQDGLVFMDTSSYEQTTIPMTLVGDKKLYLKEGALVTLVMLDEKPIEMIPPTFVELRVAGSSVSSKTDTITAQNKIVQLETGLTVGAPTFIKEGDLLKIDTRSGTYVERVNKK